MIISVGSLVLKSINNEKQKLFFAFNLIFEKPYKVSSSAPNAL